MYRKFNYEFGKFVTTLALRPNKDILVTVLDVYLEYLDEYLEQRFIPETPLKYIMGNSTQHNKT